MTKRVLFLVLLTFVFGLDLMGGGGMELKSSAFSDGGRIPTKYVMRPAGGENLSPPLSWDGVPEGTKSFAISCYDPHPIARNWVHWLVINIPANVRSLPEGASGVSMPSGSVELTNSFGFKGYGGPQPPPGTGDHPYVFTVYALSVERVDISGAPSIEGFEKAISPYVLGKASITGYYSR